MFKQFKNLFTKSSFGFSVRSDFSLAEILGNSWFKLAETSLYVNRGIKKRAEKVGQLHFTLTDIRTGEDVESEHQFLRMLDKPNERMHGREFWALASEYRDIAGFAVIKKISSGSAINTDRQKITGLELMNSERVTFTYQGDKITNFIHTKKDGTTETVPYEECIYWKRPNPRNPEEGISLLEAGLYSLDTDNQLTKYQNSIIKNGGGIQGVLSFKDALTPSQAEELEEKFGDKYAGAMKAGKPLILGGDAKYEATGLSPREMDYINSRNQFARDMTVITGVPASILGLTSGETFANADVGYRIFLRETIKPIYDDLINLLNWHLIPEGLELGYEDPTPEDNELKLKVVEVASRTRTLTLNERREALGYEPVDDGDEIEKAPQSIFEMPDEQEEDKEKKIIRLNFEGVTNKKQEHPLKDFATRRTYFAIVDKGFRDRRSKLLRDIRKYFIDQEERVQKNIRGLASLRKKTDITDIFDVGLEVNMALPLLNRIKEIAMETGQETYDIFGQGGNYNLSIATKQNLEKRFDFWANKINETTAENLTKELKEWQDSGESLADFRERIADTYVDLKDHRIPTIVNTETKIAISEAQLDGYKQMGMETKVWVHNMGLMGGVRPDHETMDGLEIGIDKLFSLPSGNTCQAPALTGDPSDDCNCQCFI